MITQTDNLKKLTKYRAQIYAFLSRIYGEELDEAFLRKIKEKNKQINFKDPEIARGYKSLKKITEQVEINEKTVQELGADYASLFLGIRRHPAHPYESVYLSKDRIVMRQPWREALRIYEEEGLTKTDEIKEPEDHVALELEFMAYMCRKMEEALDRNDTFEVSRILDVQGKFLANHLGAWIPAFCEDIARGPSKLDFYRAMAIITERFIILEKEYVAKLKEELTNLNL